MCQQLVARNQCAVDRFFSYGTWRHIDADDGLNRFIAL